MGPINDQMLSLIYRLPELIENIKIQNQLQALDLNLKLGTITKEEAKTQMELINNQIESINRTKKRR